MNTTFDQLNEVKSFDVIFIGHLASVSAYLFSNSTKDQYKSLVLNFKNNIVEPSLLPMHSEQIKINKRIKKPSVYYKQHRIVNIKPIVKQIELQGGKTYQYKYLVYTGNLEDWLNYDSIQILQEALSNQYSLVYSNVKKRDLANIYRQSSGNIVFYIPNGKHFGYDNFNFLCIFQRFQQIIKSKSQQNKAVQFKVILEGTDFFPYCKQADQLIKKQIHEKGIQILYNSKLSKIDYLRRTLTINEEYQITYNSLYCVIPQKIPELLKTAQIDPFNNNPKTLLNRKYKNIFVFGADIFPTTHSFQGIQYQSRVICRNLEHLLSKSGEISLYNGKTQIPIYLSWKQKVEICHYYDKKQHTDVIQESINTSISQNCSLINFYLNRITKLYLTENYYNYNSNGSPYYIFSPSLPSVKYLQEQKADQTSPLGFNKSQQSKNGETIEVVHNQTAALPRVKRPYNIK